MTLGFGPIRRHLIFLLTLALAISVWPSLDLSHLENAGLGNSLPWQSGPSANAIVETQAEIDPAEGSANDGGKMGNARIAVSAFLAATAQLIALDSLPPSPKHRAPFLNKTGPSSA